MERRTLPLCVNHFLKKLTVSHQDVSVLVNVYYKRRASLPSSSQCITKNLCLPRPCISVETNSNSLQSDISQQFETLQNKVSSQKEMLTDLKEKVQKVSV